MQSKNIELLYKTIIVVSAVSSIVAVLSSSMKPGDESKDQLLSIPNKQFSDWDEQKFYMGKKLFSVDWVPFDSLTGSDFSGLGPHFNQTSCFSCHVYNGRSAAPREGTSQFSSIVKLSSGNDNFYGPLLTSTLGLQLNYYATAGAPIESTVLVTYENVKTVRLNSENIILRKPRYNFKELDSGRLSELFYSVRISPQVYGLGLIELLGEEQILGNADSADIDGDGISGRANFVLNPLSSRRELGRFGWKASTTSLKHQISFALWSDIGITSPYYLHQNCDKHALCKKLDNNGKPEISDDEVNLLVMYVKCLNPPPTNHKSTAGKKIFSDIGCVSCHRQEYKVGLNNDSVRIEPFSDFLLHDMGDGLSDGFNEYLAGVREWRTPPLWGLSITKKVNNYLFLLHDGRARNFTEAILWHGGEASSSVQKFTQLSAYEKTHLLVFLNSL